MSLCPSHSRERHSMGKDELIALNEDIRTQMALIKTVVDRLEERSRDVREDDAARLESVAYQIHNLYSAVEDLLELVAAHFENNIADPSRWHSELLFRMTRKVAGVRPALLSEESYRILNGLRSFRHFFRHAYNAPIEYAQLVINLDKARRLYPALEQDVAHFLQQFDDESVESPEDDE